MDTIQSLFAITEDELMNLIEQTEIRHYNLPVVEIDGDAWAFALTDEYEYSIGFFCLYQLPTHLLIPLLQSNPHTFLF